MGLIIRNIVKDAIGRVNVAKSYAAVSVCVLLIAANVGCFIFLPKIIAPLAIILSNVVTILITLIAFQPINTIIQNAFSEKARELVEKEKAEEELQESVRQLESRNAELLSRLDTWGQMAYAPTKVNFSAKLETMTYEKEGYIVREEPVDEKLFTIAEPQGLVDLYKAWRDESAHSGPKTVLYIGKQYAAKALGIDFSKVKYAFSEGKVFLFGARISIIHDLTPQKAETDIEHCWVLNNDQDKRDKSRTVVSINTAAHYSEIPQAFSKMCREQATEEVDAEVNNLCLQYTAIFRKCLSDHYPGIIFCDSIEDTPYTWYALNERPSEKRVIPIASGMFLVANVLKDFNVS